MTTSTTTASGTWDRIAADHAIRALKSDDAKNQKLLLWALLSRAGSRRSDHPGLCWPSQPEIEADSGLCEREIRKVTRELQRRGLLIVGHRVDRGGRKRLEYDLRPLVALAASRGERRDAAVAAEPYDYPAEQFKKLAEWPEASFEEQAHLNLQDVQWTEAQIRNEVDQFAHEREVDALKRAWDIVIDAHKEWGKPEPHFVTPNLVKVSVMLGECQSEVYQLHKAMNARNSGDSLRIIPEGIDEFAQLAKWLSRTHAEKMCIEPHEWCLSVVASVPSPEIWEVCKDVIPGWTGFESFPEMPQHEPEA